MGFKAREIKCCQFCRRNVLSENGTTIVTKVMVMGKPRTMSRFGCHSCLENRDQANARIKSEMKG